MKYLRINLTEYVQDLYEETYKTLMKEIKDELNKWRDIPCSWINRLNIVKMSVLLNLIYKFNEIPIKIWASYFVDIDKRILKFMWREKKIQNSQHNIEGEKQSWRTGSIWLQNLL